MPGKEDLPSLYENYQDAEVAAHELGRAHIGATVHVLKFESVGTVSYPATPRVTGSLNPHAFPESNKRRPP
jgi:hypothetical protein